MNTLLSIIIVIVYVLGVIYTLYRAGEILDDKHENDWWALLPMERDDAETMFVSLWMVIALLWPIVVVLVGGSKALLTICELLLWPPRYIINKGRKK